MAVFTDLSDTDFSQIASAFALDPFRSVIGIRDGDAETTYVVVAGDRNYILTIFETAVDMHDIERAFNTMETLVAADVPCPTPLRTTEGAPAVKISGKLAAIVSFVEGNVTKVSTIAKCRSLGAVIGRVHLALSAPPGGPAVADAKLPVGGIHGAVTRENVFFTADAVSGVINFRARHTDFLVVEIADALVTWCAGERRFDPSLSAAFLAGYENIRSLTAREKEALPMLLLSQMARHRATGASLGEVSGANDLHRMADFAATWIGAEEVSKREA